MVEKFKKYFSNGSKIIPMFMFMLISITLIVCGMRKTIIVDANGKKIQITTLRSTYGKALSANNIIVGPKDKTLPELDSKIKDNSKIFIKKAVDVEVKVDGRNLKIKSAEENVQNMLKAEKIKINAFDKIYPSKKEKIKKDLKVSIVRVQTKVIKENKPIEFSTVVKKDDNVEKGKKVVKQSGQNGEKLISSRVVYEDGKEVSRKMVSETVIKQPKQKIIAMGTVGIYTPSRGGNIRYSRVLRMRATAYTADYASTGKSPGDNGFGITATGTTARRNSGGYSSVAVDPRVIPLGTKLYVEGYGYAIAEDTGGAIKGNRIDVFFNNKSLVNNWGVKWVNVYIIK